MLRIDYRRLRTLVSMADVLRLLRFQPTWRRGAQLRGPCPVPGCRSTKRTFSVHLTKQVYRCFACGSHGNPLDLWVAVRCLPLHQAALDLCRTISLSPPWLANTRPTSTPRPTRRVPIRDSSRNH